VIDLNKCQQLAFLPLAFTLSPNSARFICVANLNKYQQVLIFQKSLLLFGYQSDRERFLCSFCTHFHPVSSPCWQWRLDVTISDEFFMGSGVCIGCQWLCIAALGLYQDIF